MGVGLLLGAVLLDELLGGLEGILVLVAFALHGDLVADLVLDGLVVFLAFAHDVGQHVLLPRSGQELLSGGFHC